MKSVAVPAATVLVNIFVILLIAFAVRPCRIKI